MIISDNSGARIRIKLLNEYGQPYLLSEIIDCSHSDLVKTRTHFYRAVAALQKQGYKLFSLQALIFSAMKWRVLAAASPKQLFDQLEIDPIWLDLCFAE